MEDSVTEDRIGVGLETLTRWFDDAEEMGEQGRKESERARDYYDGRQWTRDEIEALRKRKQPAVTDNRIKRKVDYLRGLEVASRVDPKAYPRTPNEQKSAEAATDALRYAMDRARFQQKRALVWENLCVEGAGGVTVEVEPSGTGYDVRLTHIPWDRLFWDPHSRAADFSDARYTGVVVWMDAADARQRWPDRGEVIDEAVSRTVSFSRTYDDRPERGHWSDPERKRIRFAEIYYQHDEGWCRAVFTQAGFLEDSAPSPYLDENGQPANAMVLASCYVDRDNDRYGVVRDMISPQDEVNKRKQKSLHLLSVRQVIADQGAVADVDEARRQLARPDGYIETSPNLRFEIQQTGDLATGQVTLLQEAKASLDLMGPNAAMQGKQGKEASGRAIALSQQGGQIEVSALTDAMRDWHWRVMRQVWNRIRQFWTGETWIRVTDDPHNMRWVAMNRPVTLAEDLQEMPDEERAQRMMFMQLAPGDPRLGEVVRVDNKLADLDVDLILEEAPDTVTIQAEEFQTLAELAKAGFPIPPDVLIEASSLRNKDVILERLRAQAQQPPPPDPRMMNVERQAAKDQMDAAQQRDELAFKRDAKAADVAMDAAQIFAQQAVPVIPAA